MLCICSHQGEREGEQRGVLAFGGPIIPPPYFYRGEMDERPLQVAIFLL